MHSFANPGYAADMTERDRSEGDVSLEEEESAADTAPPGEQPVGRVQGQDDGYAGETGAEARAEQDGEGIGGAAGGRS